MTTPKQTVLVVGGTGAQGSAIVRTLSSTSKYTLLVLTRNITSPHSLAISSLPHVSLIEDPTPVGFDISTFVTAARRADAVFVNTNGFAIGEILETYWGIRLFELSVYAGVRHFVYSGLDDVGRESGYDPEMYVAHYQGKNRVQDWIKAQPPASSSSPLRWTILRSGPYIESLLDNLAPQIAPSGTAVFALPLGSSGQIPFVSLTDFGRIVDWSLSHPDQSASLDLGVAIAHAGLAELAAAYTAVTGKAAVTKDIHIDEWNKVAWANLPQGGNEKIGSRNVSDGNALSLSYKENFEHWFNLYRASEGNKGLIRRDYEMLDRILPDRIRSVEKWMRKTGYNGEKRKVLKTDVRNGDE